MGRATPSLREKLTETLRIIERELLPMLSKERRMAYEKLVQAWMEEYSALTCYSNPHLLTSLLLVAVLDLQAQIDRLAAAREEALGRPLARAVLKVSGEGAVTLPEVLRRAAGIDGGEVVAEAVPGLVVLRSRRPAEEGATAH